MPVLQELGSQEKPDLGARGPRPRRLGGTCKLQLMVQAKTKIYVDRSPKSSEIEAGGTPALPGRPGSKNHAASGVRPAPLIDYRNRNQHGICLILLENEP